jgi:hypothetical protein
MREPYEVCGTPDIIELDEDGKPLPEPRPPAPYGTGWCGWVPLPLPELTSAPPPETDDT